MRCRGDGFESRDLEGRLVWVVLTPELRDDAAAGLVQILRS